MVLRFDRSKAGMNMGGKVVNIAARQERWNTAFDCGDIVFSVSNHGRLNITLEGRDITLNMTEAVQMLGAVSAEYDRIIK